MSQGLVWYLILHLSCTMYLYILFSLANQGQITFRDYILALLFGPCILLMMLVLEMTGGNRR